MVVKQLTQRLALLLVACWFTGAAAQEQEGMAALRIAHMSPDAPLIDVLVGERLHLKDMPFGEVSGYLNVPTGTYEIRVFPHLLPSERDSSPAEPTTTGKDDTAAGDQSEEETAEEEAAPVDTASRRLEPVVINAELQAGERYTVVLSGFYQPPPAPSELGNFSLNVTPDSAELTIAGPRGYSADFTGDQLIEDLEPGTYTITANQEGYQAVQYEATLQPDTTTVVSLSLQREEAGESTPPPPPQEQVQPALWQKVELHVYKDTFDGFPAAGQSLIRFIHASPITPTIAASALLVEKAEAEEVTAEVDTQNSILLADNLAFPNDSDYHAVVADAYRLQLNRYGTEHTLTELAALGLEPGTIYTIFMVGTAEDSYLSLIPVVDAGLLTSP